MAEQTEIQDEPNLDGEQEGSSDRFVEPDYGALADEEMRTEALEEVVESGAPAEEAPPPEPTEETTAESVEATAPVKEPVEEVPAAAAGATPAQPEVSTPAIQAPEQTQPGLGSEPPLEQMVQEVQARLTEFYKLPPEQAAAVDEVSALPSEYLPKMFADVHQRVFTGVFEAVMSQLPEAVTAISTQTVREREAENSFFTRWPDLRGHQGQALAAIRTYRNMYPQAPINEVVERAGAMAMVALGRPLANPEPQRPPASPTPPPPPAGVGGSAEVPRQASPRSYEEKVFAQMMEQELQ